MTLHIDEIAYQKNFENLKRRFFIEAGYLNGGTKLRISHDQEGDIIPKIYRVDEFVLGQIYDKLSRQVFDPGSVKDNEISGRIEMKRAGLLMTTIPYDEGWHIWVNGERRTPRKYLNAFLALELNEGEQEIQMRYIPKGFFPGLWISLTGMLLLLMLHLVSVGVKRKEAREAKEANGSPGPPVSEIKENGEDQEYEIYEDAGTGQ